MFRISTKFFLFVFCLLFAVSPQAHAWHRADLKTALFIDPNAALPPDAADLETTLFFHSEAELPPDADVIAEVVLTGTDLVHYERPTAANIVRVIKTSDSRVSQGEELSIKFGFSVCQISGDQGIIAAKIGSDIEDRLVLCLFSRRFSDGHIDLPNRSRSVIECNPSAIKAVKHIKQAAESGDAEAQYQLGCEYDYKYDFIESVKWHAPAAAQGHLKAAKRLGQIYDGGGGGIKIDHDESIKWYRIAAEKGDAEAQCGLGRAYALKHNYNASFHWYKLAADQGNTRAMERVGVSYQYGRGVEQNGAEAVKWYRLALERGYTYVLTSLVNIYLQRQVIVENDVEVEKWFRLSAENGYNEAQFGLGRMYQMGKNVEQNDAEAIKWYLLAADQRNNGARKALLAMDRQGRGLAANYVEVTRLLQLAADKKIRRAQAVLESLQNSNSAEGE